MKILKSCFDFYINSSIHVGIEVCAFVLITSFQLDFPTDPVFLVFVFFGTITGYNFIKYAALAQWRHFTLKRNLRLIQAFSFFCFLAFIYFTLKLPLKTLSVTAFFGIFTLLYALPVFPEKRSLRSIEGIKIFIIAVVVGGLTIIVPVIHHSISLDANVLLLFLQRLIFIVAVILPFEIRDINSDETALGTIPQKIGVKKAKFLGILLLAIFILMEFFRPNTPAELLSAGITAILSAGLIIFSSREQSKYYASFWVDAIPIFWFLILLMITGFFL